MNALNLLKNCPFCGGKAELWRARDGQPKRRAWIACMGECCVLVTPERTTDEEAIEVWNRRHDETPSEYDRLIGKENSNA